MSIPVMTFAEVEVITGPNDFIHGAHLDTPREGFGGDSYGLVIEGWLVTKSLGVQYVEVLHEERPIAVADVDRERPDIADAYPEVEGAGQSGYRASVAALKLPTEFEIILRARLEDDTRLPLGSLRGRRRQLTPTAADAIQPLIVNTIGRSGSTLLVTQLSSHPEVVAFSPFVKDARVATYWINVLQDLSEPASFLSAFDPDDLDAPRWWLGSGNAARLGDPEVEQWMGSEAIDSLAGVCASRIETFYRHLAGTGGTPRYFVEKSQPHHLVSDLLAELYPAAREVILVRDFRDMLCSVIAFSRKRGFEAFGRGEGGDTEYVRTNLLQSATALAQRLQSTSAQPHLIRYEDLIQAPKNTFSELLAYLGLDSDPDLVEETLDRASESTVSMQHPGSGEQVDLLAHRTTPDPAASIGRWREDLPDEIAEICNEVLGPLLVKFGYEVS
jgi:hypothetical protein